MNSVCLNLLCLAVDEGRQNALKVAEELQGSLESLSEMSSSIERIRIIKILESVNLSITLMLDNSKILEILEHDDLRCRFSDELRKLVTPFLSSDQLRSFFGDA